MRKIEFRAWDKKDNKWIYFSLLDLTLVNYESMTDKDYALLQLENVGQYIGLEDKRGNRLYEGDILTDGGIITFCEGIFRPKYPEYKFSTIVKDWNKFVEVAGNIYENPELVGIFYERN